MSERDLRWRVVRVDRVWYVERKNGTLGGGVFKDESDAYDWINAFEKNEQ